MQTFQQIRVVALDCDGVMFDSSAVNKKFYNLLLQAFHLPDMTEKDFYHVHMYTAEGAIRYLFEGKVDLDLVREEQKKIHYPDLFPLMIEEPFLRELLSCLRPNFKTAVATNRSNTLRPLLDHFQLTPLFDLLITSMDVPRPKPWPDMLLKVAEHFGVAPEEVLYIGDSPLDLQCARTAGCPFVGFGTGLPEAEIRVESLGEISPLLKI